MMKSLTNGIMNYALIVPILIFTGTALTSTTFLHTPADIVGIESYNGINITTKYTEKVSVSTISEQLISEKTLDINVPKPDTIPTGKIYPKPTNIPLLRDYDINKDSNVEIWHAHNPESYIIKNDEWVKHVASQLYIDNHGRLRYKNMPISAYQDEKGNILEWTDEPFLNNYISDNDLFNYPANADLWQNADYYLSHGMKGDCEDWAIAVVSMMLSGELSIKENGSFIRQVIPAKVVMGLSGNNLDSWIEFKAHGNIYISSTGHVFNPSIGQEQSITTFNQKNETNAFDPIYQFTDKHFGRYNNNI